MRFLLIFTVLFCSLFGMRTHVFFEELFDKSEDKTEYYAYLALQKHPISEEVNYLAVPWGHLLDEHLPLPRLRLKGGFTICQHPNFELIIPLLKKIGIDTLFTPHVKPKRYLGITVLPFPVYPLPERKEKTSLAMEFYDALAQGDIPVLYTNEVLLPSCINWDGCLLFLKTHEATKRHKLLQKLKVKQQAKMRQKCASIYQRFLTKENFARVCRDFYAQKAPYSMISYENDPDKWLGRNLYAYIKAKWIAYKYDLPFFYQPFDQSDDLRVDELEEHIPYVFKQEISINSLKDFDPKSKSVYYIDDSYKDPDWDDAYEVGDWHEMLQDEKFLAHIRRRITPSAPLQQLVIPNDTAKVAVHIKRGSSVKYPLFSEQVFSTYDITKKGPSLELPFADIKQPLRFPPLQFYISQIKSISQQEANRPMYVHIFTDAENPKEILEKVRQGVNLPNITWGIREDENSYLKHIQDDLFALRQFDYLIRPRSSFSQLATLLADYKMIRYPKKAFWAGHRLIVIAN